MADMVISGFVGVGIQMAINQILRHITIAMDYKNELESLNDLLLTLQDINSALQKYRLALTSGEGNTSQELIPSAVNNWLKKLDTLLQQASEMVRQCTVTISSYDVFSSYKMSKRISRTISRIKEHRENAASIGITIQLMQSLSPLRTLDTDIAASRSSSAILREGKKYIGEPLIVGQDTAFVRLEELLQNSSQARIGVVGMGGVGKTLILKRLFNSHQVQNLFPNGSLFWLTVSQTPSFTALRNDLGSQIAFKTNDNFDQTMSEDDSKLWLNRKMREVKFALFLDDVWGKGAILLEELGVPLPAVCNSNPDSDSSVIMVSSRNSSALLELGVPNTSTVQMQQLMDDESWQLFLSHAFPHNHENLPTNINEETARGICRVCGGLPLALKVTGRAMAGITSSEGWEFRLKKLQNAEPIKGGDVAASLYGRLRLSYDTLADLDISLQLCFLYLAAFAEDEIIRTEYVSKMWFGEGLLDRHDPYKQGQTYVDALADRCLIEPVFKGTDGRITRFKLHDVLYTLARQIAETEENCFFCSGRGLQEFPANECSGQIRISLKDNKFRCVPSTFRGPHIRSLLLTGNFDLKEISKQVILSMTSLTVLDLSYTSLDSLPETIGCLKHLVSLFLSNVPITKLPNSVTALKNLEILNLYRSHIRSLPCKIHKLTSLRILDLSYCKNLHSLPYRISQLKSLESFQVQNSPNVWLNMEPNKGKRRPLLIHDLSALSQLKSFSVSYNGETIQEGMLGSMMQMESLSLRLTKMKSLPHDMTVMSKLRKLDLNCPQLIKMEHPLCGLQHLRRIKLFECGMLKQLPDLHKLVSLKQLDIVRCRNIEKLPKEFGDKGAFPKLETLSIAQLDSLQELPVVEEEAMPSLKTLSLVQCESLQILPESYWNLKNMIKIRVYGCSAILNKMQENRKLRRKEVQIVTMSTTDTEVAVERIHNIVKNNELRWYGESYRVFWSSDSFPFLYHTFNMFQSFLKPNVL